MKAMVVLALLLLPVVSHADVVIPENEQKPRVPRKAPAVVKTDTTATAPTTATTTTAATTAATTSAAVTETTATTAPVATATRAPAPVEASTVPKRRRTTFPFIALATIGIVLVAATGARRRRNRKAQ